MTAIDHGSKSQGAFKNVSEQRRDGSSLQYSVALTKCGDEAVPPHS